MALRPDSTPDLPRWRTKTVVVAGAQDQIIPAAATDALARGIPGARHTVVPGAGHLAFVDKPSEVLAELRWLLD